MQKFRMLQGQENVKNSREAINENFISVASNFAGDAFPTSNLYVGMKFYHTGEQKTYTLRQIDPVRWDEDASGRLKNARNISLTGKVQSATVGFDGTADIALQVTRVEADVCNGNAASATVAASVKGAISSQNAPRHVWFSGANNETQREYANNFVYNPATGTLAVPHVEGTASLASRAFTADRAGADGNGANIAATYATKNGAGASGTWGINIGGRSVVANVSDRVGNDAADMRFHWSGQGGQPIWLWGGNNPNDSYVWNPSNFNVNHANTANSAGSANTAGRANTAERADFAARADNAKNADRAETARKTDGAEYSNRAVRVENDYRNMRFHWSGPAKNGQPNAVWGGNDGENMYVYNPSNFTVSRANTAGWTNNAKRADSAGYADNAGQADNSNKAKYADSAGWTNNAKRAESAGWADGAQRAKSVERADAAGYADRAGYSNNAGTVGGKTIEQIKDESSRVVTISGEILDGGTIPLPNGYTEAQCKWIVSMKFVSLYWENGYMTDFVCCTNGRVVRCCTERPGKRRKIINHGVANYFVVGVK